MYTTRSSIILAFHGCDESLVDEILLGKKTLEQSKNKYDWLGNGIYFWENSPSRALEFANELHKSPNIKKEPIKNPSVIGAVINLGHCLDLLDYQNLVFLKDSYSLLSTSMDGIGKKLPENKPLNHSGDLILKELDCAVIESMHRIIEINNLIPFDSIRGVFWEGEEIYPNAGFREKNHIQICIRNPNCIKGYFKPRVFNNKFKNV